MKQILNIISSLLLSVYVHAQQNYFSKAPTTHSGVALKVTPGKYFTTTLDILSFKNFLQPLPLEFTSKRNATPVLHLPMPDGSMARFHVWKTTIMEARLAARYPQIQTFAGTGIDDKYASLQFEINPYSGFSAQIISIHGNVYIEAVEKKNINQYISYDTKDYHRELSSFNCKTFMDDANRPDSSQLIEAGQCRGSQLFTYRLALACTGEYATAVCAPAAPTVPATLAAIVTTLNRVNGIYEKELAMRFLLVANNNQVVYTNPATDPFTNGNESVMMNENQATLNSVIGTTNYDVGMVLGTGNANAASIYGICNFPGKGKAVSSLNNPTGDLFDVGRVAHNLGHLFGALDTHNSNASLCNPDGFVGYEPGAGTTIMSAAGNCGSDNLQSLPDPYFHSTSFNSITNFITGTGTTGCHGIINTGNTPPRFTNNVIYATSIPMNTPFQLRGVTATDDDSDPITYSWEELDRGPTGAWNSAATTEAPAFRSRVPQANIERIFPDMQLILAGYPANPPAIQGGLKGETLSSISREYIFSITLRDGRGGVMNAENNCSSTIFGRHAVGGVAGTGPFKVNLPNGSENWSAGSQQTILWDVAGSTVAQINAQTVNILMSEDGGLTYPYFLAMGVPNDGFEVVSIPTISTSTARIKIEAGYNAVAIFFDISDANFSISLAPIGFEFNSPSPQTVLCPSPSSVQFSLGTISNGGYNTVVALSANNLPAGTTASFGNNPVTPGNSTTITLNGINTVPQGIYYITITGLSGSISRSRVLVLNVQTGTPSVITIQPVSQSDCEGGTVTFTIASPSAISFQWQRSTDGGFTFSNISPGGNQPTLTINNLSGLESNRRYRCIVIGQCNSTISTVVQANVLLLPFISSQPQNVTLCEGGSRTMNVVVSGTSPTYQWQQNNNSGSGFVNIAGAITNTLSLNNVTTSMNNYQYRCLIFNAGCTTPLISSTATLTVNQLPQVMISAAPYIKLLPGLETTITANASASAGSLPFSLRWTLNGVTLGGVSGNSYNAGITRIGNYQVYITDAKGCVNQSNILNIGDSISNRLFVFPNPARTSIEFAFHNPGGQVVDWRISIYNSSGEKMLFDKVSSNGAYPKMLENVSKFASGLYFIYLTDASGKVLANGKFIVQQ